jgi:hypothetical protein
VGSLRVFRAGSTQAYGAVMGWTEVVSASPLSVGALQCILRLPYLVQYITTVALPLLAALAVAAIFLSVSAARVAHIRPRCSCNWAAFRIAVKEWMASKRHLSTLLFVLFLAYMPIISASLRALDCVAPIAGLRYLRSDLGVECGVGQHAAARTPCWLWRGSVSQSGWRRCWAPPRTASCLTTDSTPLGASCSTATGRRRAR